MAEMDVNLTSHKEEILRGLASQLPAALEAIGGEMERHAKQGCPVDTGRLRNSITFATVTAQGSPNTDGGAPAQPEDYAMKATPGQYQVVVGTNVEYAPENEYFHKTKPHFLKNAATNHSIDYKNIVKAALQT